MRELERQKFDAEISLLKAALKEQMDVSQEAVASMQQVKEELWASREESRKWQEELRHSRLMSHGQAGPSHSPTVTSPADDQTARLTARLQRARDRLSGQPQTSEGQGHHRQVPHRSPTSGHFRSR